MAGRTAGSGLSLGLLCVLMIQRRDGRGLCDLGLAVGVAVQVAVSILPIACRAGLGAGGGNCFYLGDGLPAQQRIAGAVGSKLIAQGRGQCLQLVGGLGLAGNFERASVIIAHGAQLTGLEEVGVFQLRICIAACAAHDAAEISVVAGLHQFAGVIGVGHQLLFVAHGVADDAAYAEVGGLGVGTADGAQVIHIGHGALAVADDTAHAAVGVITGGGDGAGVETLRNHGVCGVHMADDTAHVMAAGDGAGIAAVADHAAVVALDLTHQAAHAIGLGIDSAAVGAAVDHALGIVAHQAAGIGIVGGGGSDGALIGAADDVHGNPRAGVLAHQAAHICGRGDIGLVHAVHNGDGAGAAADLRHKARRAGGRGSGRDGAGHGEVLQHRIALDHGKQSRRAGSIHIHGDGMAVAVEGTVIGCGVAADALEGIGYGDVRHDLSIGIRLSAGDQAPKPQHVIDAGEQVAADFILRGGGGIQHGQLERSLLGHAGIGVGDGDQASLIHGGGVFLCAEIDVLSGDIAVAGLHLHAGQVDLFVLGKHGSVGLCADAQIAHHALFHGDGDVKAECLSAIDAGNGDLGIRQGQGHRGGHTELVVLQQLAAAVAPGGQELHARDVHLLGLHIGELGGVSLELHLLHGGRALGEDRGHRCVGVARGGQACLDGRIAGQLVAAAAGTVEQLHKAIGLHECSRRQGGAVIVIGDLMDLALIGAGIIHTTAGGRAGEPVAALPAGTGVVGADGHGVARVFCADLAHIVAVLHQHLVRADDAAGGVIVNGGNAAEIGAVADNAPVPACAYNAAAALGVRVVDGGKVHAVFNNAAGSAVAQVTGGGLADLTHDAAHAAAGIDIAGEGQVAHGRVHGGVVALGIIRLPRTVVVVVDAQASHNTHGLAITEVAAIGVAVTVHILQDVTLAVQSAVEAGAQVRQAVGLCGAIVNVVHQALAADGHVAGAGPVTVCILPAAHVQVAADIHRLIFEVSGGNTIGFHTVPIVIGGDHVVAVGAAGIAGGCPGDDLAVRQPGILGRRVVLRNAVAVRVVHNAGDLRVIDAVDDGSHTGQLGRSGDGHGFSRLAVPADVQGLAVPCAGIGGGHELCHGDGQDIHRALEQVICQVAVEFIAVHRSDDAGFGNSKGELGGIVAVLGNGGGVVAGEQLIGHAGRAVSLGLHCLAREGILPIGIYDAAADRHLGVRLGRADVNALILHGNDACGLCRAAGGGDGGITLAHGGDLAGLVHSGDLFIGGGPRHGRALGEYRRLQLDGVARLVQANLALVQFHARHGRLGKGTAVALGDGPHRRGVKRCRAGQLVVDGDRMILAGEIQEQPGLAIFIPVGGGGGDGKLLALVQALLDKAVLVQAAGIVVCAVHLHVVKAPGIGGDVLGIHNAQVHVLARLVGAQGGHADVVDALGHGQALVVAGAAHVLCGVLIHIGAHGAAGKIHAAAGGVIAGIISTAAHRGAGEVGVDVHRAATEVDLGPLGGTLAAGAAADDGTAAVGNEVILAGEEGHPARRAGTLGVGTRADDGALLGALDKGGSGHGEGDLAVHLVHAAADARAAGGLIQVQRAAAADGQCRVLGHMDVGMGAAARAVLIHDHGALNVQFVISPVKVHQGAGVVAILQEHVLEGQLRAGGAGAVELQIFIGIRSDLARLIDGHAGTDNGHRIRRADGDGPGGVIRQGVGSPCRDDVVFRHRDCRRVLSPGHLRRRRHKAQRHNKRQQQRQCLFACFLHLFRPFF